MSDNYPKIPRLQAHPGDLTEAEMKDHMALGRSILVSPKYEYDKDQTGRVNDVRMVSQGAHLTHPGQIQSITELTTLDPEFIPVDEVALAKLRSEAEKQATAKPKGK